MSGYLEGWCMICQAGGRVLVRWGGRDFYPASDRFACVFSRHGQEVWSATQHAWSLPGCEYARVCEWAVATFGPGCVEVVDDTLDGDSGEAEEVVAGAAE